MKVVFEQINIGWNAEPNAPDPKVKIVDSDLLLTFYLNPFLYPEFDEDELGILRFVNSERYRLGSTNDEGWYRDQCRFSKLAPEWGEFYLISGDKDLLEAPVDWKILGPKGEYGKHYLFYFRDNTFECVADRCLSEESAYNGLTRSGFKGRKLND